MSRRRSDNISEELLEALEEFFNNRNNNRRDDRFNNINANNDWCPGCSNDSFCNNNDDRFDDFNCCNRRNRRNKFR